MTSRERNKKHKQKILLRNSIFIAGCSVVLITIFLVSMKVGFSKFTFADTINTILGSGTDKQNLILFKFRMPGIVISALIGAGLSLSGCIIQGITRNPLAEPGILGLNAGSGLVVVLYIICFGSNNFASIMTLPFLSMAGAGAAALAVYLLAYQKQEGSEPSRLVLTGIAVQAGISALTTILVVKLDDSQFDFFASWQAGQIVGANWNFVLSLLPWLVILIPYAIFKGKVLDILNLGDEMATGLGVSINKERKKLLIISVMLAASCVAVGGNITFVGLVAPHLARKILGPKHSFLLPSCALIGSILVLSADTLGRVLLQPSGIPTGIMTAIIGAPYFLFLIYKIKQKEGITK